LCWRVLDPAHAQVTGVNTPGGSGRPLYLGANGNVYMTIGTNGNVGVGLTTTPQAPLDVNGGVRGSNSSIVSGQPCAPEGMLAYDMNRAVPVYCSHLLQWTVMSSALASCPTGYTLIGSAGTDEAFCISTSAQTPGVDWLSAVNACYSVGAHMCTVAEWSMACVSGLASGMGTQYEWVPIADSLTPGTSDYRVAMGQGNCAQSTMQGNPTYPYRCCFR
jgi:hypothetical protein